MSPRRGAAPCPPVLCWGGPDYSIRPEVAPSPPVRGRCPRPGACHPLRGESRFPPSAGSVPLTSSVRGRPWLGCVRTLPPPCGCSNSAHPPSLLPCYHHSGGHSPLHPPDWGRHRMCLADWRPPARSHPLVSRGSACKAPPYIVAGGRKARPGNEVLKGRGGPAPGSDGPPFQRFYILNQTPGGVVICFLIGFSPRASVFRPLFVSKRFPPHRP